MADRGHAGPAYGRGAGFRFAGPKLAADMGAAAALVRSVGGANYRIPTPAPPAWWRARAFPPPPSPPKTRC
jgi:hypothetical protein